MQTKRLVMSHDCGFEVHFDFINMMKNYQQWKRYLNETIFLNEWLSCRVLQFVVHLLPLCQWTRSPSEEILSLCPLSFFVIDIIWPNFSRSFKEKRTRWTTLHSQSFCLFTFLGGNLQLWLLICSYKSTNFTNN